MQNCTGSCLITNLLIVHSIQKQLLGSQKFNTYTEDLANLIDDHHLDHHMYADDTQLIEYTMASDILNAIIKLQNCVEAIHEWCRSRRLQINPAISELIWFGSKASLKKTVLDLNLYIGADIIKPVGVVQDLGVFLDSELNMDQHVKTVVHSCFFHLRHLKSVRRIVGGEVTLDLVSAFVTTRLDYCIFSVLAGLPQATINPLQRVQNAAERLVAGIGTRDHITPFSQAGTGFRSSYAYNTNCACLCGSVAVLPNWLT